ncbi:MAG TPA: PEP/pyruvate-binding domain-containing protein, partial [Longimicrobiales bacterium]|nr:PEP/pyruvate-binding domain-containing protein [Longimicrobiales bacterium]
MPSSAVAFRGALITSVLLGSAAPVPAQQAFPPPPSADVVAEVRTAVEAMKGDERGPYLRIRWFCADGSVRAPAPGTTPCTEVGGGVQHAEFGPAALRLAALEFHVGTILQGTTFDEFADTAHAGFRLRELVMEAYLSDVDDGWVLRRGRYYRGARQIENEEATGRAHLEQLVGREGWVRSNYLLSLRLAADVPHPHLGSGRTMDRIRALASEIAETEPGFLRIRVKIHSVPSRDDADAVALFLGSHPNSGAAGKLTELRDLLRQQYDPTRALASLTAYEDAAPAPVQEKLATVRSTLERGEPATSLAALAAAAVSVRQAAETGGRAATTVDLLDLQLSLQERAFVLAQEGPTPRVGATRVEALGALSRFVDLAYGGGYVSGRERATLQGQIASLVTAGELEALAYKTRLGSLARSLDWARGTVRGTFAPVVDRYAPVEPKAAGLYDALLRGSILLPLSRTLDALQTDADAALGSSHDILGASVGHGVRGLNPGVAQRTFRILRDGHGGDVDARTIYALPETPAELKPVAGVLTLDVGNLLSHVQLLARNLGIPNAAVDPSLLPRLEEADGREVFYAVSPFGRVVLKWPQDLTDEERALVATGQPAQTQKYALDISRLRLDVTGPIPLADLRSAQSGVVVGPKAANLGQLAADFPGRVSRGVALPFGMFVRHANRPFDGSSGTVLEEIRSAYAQAADMRRSGSSDAEVNAFMTERLAWVRRAIEGLDWIPDMRQQILDALDTTLGGELERGVFVRSDTNVEDLPQFSGAGLNLTVPNQTSEAEVLSSVKRVWTSPFSERAYLWRSQILDEQGDVYPSVLLLESVPSEKSGVLITSGLQEGRPEDLTVVTAE